MNTPDPPKHAKLSPASGRGNTLLLERALRSTPPALLPKKSLKLLLPAGKRSCENLTNLPFPTQRDSSPHSCRDRDHNPHSGLRQSCVIPDSRLFQAPKKALFGPPGAADPGALRSSSQPSLPREHSPGTQARLCSGERLTGRSEIASLGSASRTREHNRSRDASQGTKTTFRAGTRKAKATN